MGSPSWHFYILPCAGVMCMVHPPQREASLWPGSAVHRILLGFPHIVGDGSVFEEQRKEKRGKGGVNKQKGREKCCYLNTMVLLQVLISYRY